MKTNRSRIKLPQFILKFFVVTLILFSVVSSDSAIQKQRLLIFSGQTNRSHFKFINHPKLSKCFAPDFVWDIRHFEDPNEFQLMISLLRKKNPNIIIGCYNSACTTMPSEKDSFPASKLPLEYCDKKWLLKHADGKRFVFWSKPKKRYFLDVRKKEVREAVINLAIARTKHYNLDAVCFDNCYWQIAPLDFPVSRPDWTDAFMLFFQEAGIACRKEGLKCIVNVASHADNIPKAFTAISPHVDGIATELAFHPNMRSEHQIKIELQAYEDVLQKGTMVFLFIKPDYFESAVDLVKPLAEKYRGIYLAPTAHLSKVPICYTDEVFVN